MSKQVLTNFSKGELGPELHGRIDIPQYGAGAKRIRNFIIQKYGGLSFRPGFRFVGEADDVTTPMRYVPFDYGLENAYVLAFANGNFRAMARGGMVLEDDIQIRSITQQVNAVVEAPFHGFAPGDKVFFSGIVGMTELNGSTATVLSVIDDSNFVIDIDTNDFGAFVGSSGTLRVEAPAPPPPPPPPPPEPAPVPSPPVVGGGGGTVDWGNYDGRYGFNPDLQER